MSAIDSTRASAPTRGSPKSRASTPTRDSPKSSAEWRFPWITTPTEWIESYRPGGFHPVQLGDELDDGRYRIVRKLGYGSFSTVWLAHDTSLARMVAIKIATSSTSEASKELQIHRIIDESSSVSELAKQYILQLLDHFNVQGPNGTHLCLVFEPAGLSLSCAMDIMKVASRPQACQSQEPSISITDDRAKVLIKQMLLGIHCLHSCELAHGDLNFGNILFCVDQPRVADITRLTQKPVEKDEISPPVVRRDGKSDRWAPSYLCIDRPLMEVGSAGAMSVKVSDFGAAFRFSDPPARVITPLCLQAPEVVLGLPFNHSIDCWSFACLMFETITHCGLFDAWSFGRLSPDEEVDLYMLCLIDVLGQPPPHLFEKWPRRYRYYSPELKRIRSDYGPDRTSEQWIEPDKTSEEEIVPDETEQDIEPDGTEQDIEPDEISEPDIGPDETSEQDVEPDETSEERIEPDETSEQDIEPWEKLEEEVYIGLNLSQKFYENKPKDMSDEEAEKILSVLRALLQFEPDHRPSTTEILELDWFQSIDASHQSV